MSKKQAKENKAEDNGIGEVLDEPVEVIDDRNTRPRDYVEEAAAVEETPAFDDSPANDLGHVPDPPFHGKYTLLVGVDFVNDKGKDIRIEPGVINGGDLPLAFAEELLAQGRLVKA
ncbi:MAG: hypothetical protein JO053_01455 [Acidobacteria bacterium]|nr:hypothetical protein [Acidobacteriota bacterium]